MNQWTNDTATIISKHQKDFNKANYSAKMSACGGYSAYVKSLGGVFQKLYGDNTPPQTVQEFRQHVEFVQGLMAIWGFDYNNGKHYYKWGNGSSDRFYSSGGSGKCNGGTITQLCQGTGGRGRTTNCNYGIDTLLRHMGLYKKGSDAFTTWATKYGKPVASKASLKPGDMVHFFNKSVTRTKVSTWKGKGWKHIAIVHTVDKANKKIWLADFGSRFITSKKPLHYMPINTSALAGGEYTGYWAAIHAFSFPEEEEIPMLNGVDIASYQEGIDFAKVPADFVIIKATEGTGYINPDLNRAYKNAGANGKLCGLYHYANGTDPAAEADFFIKTAGSRIGDALLALDWERVNNNAFGKNDVAWVKAWLDRVYDKTGVRPLVYMSQSVTLAHDWASVATDYGLWVAQYVVESRSGYKQDYAHGITGAWKYPAIWQYTSGGYLSGWSARLDLDVAYMSRDAWNRYAGKSEEVDIMPRTIKKGSTGAAVKVLQSALGGLTIDGKYGAKTDEKVRAFQKKKGLTVDGIVGPKTWRAVIASLA